MDDDELLLRYSPKFIHTYLWFTIGNQYYLARLHAFSAILYNNVMKPSIVYLNIQIETKPRQEKRSARTRISFTSSIRTQK